MVALQGERVVLRTLERAHCRELWERYEPVQPLPTEPLQPGLSVEGAQAWFEALQAKQGKEQVYLGIFAGQGRLVGDVQLANIDWRHRTAVLGLGIARQADRGQGHGTDAALTMLRFGFVHLDLYRVEAETVEYNVGAQRLLEKCGFTLEGEARQAIYCDGRRWGRLMYGLLKGECVGIPRSRS
jgi:RimJ/RimL family protein N-acetyltransferase